MKPKSLALYIIDTNDSILPERRAEAIDFVNAQADELITLRAQLAEAREIIEPFAAEAGMWGSKTSDGETPIIRGSDGKGDEAAFTVGDLRKAQKWYEKVKSA